MSKRKIDYEYTFNLDYSFLALAPHTLGFLFVSFYFAFCRLSIEIFVTGEGVQNASFI